MIPGGGPAADVEHTVVSEAALGLASTRSPAVWTELLVVADAVIERDRAAGETTCVVVVAVRDGRAVGASVVDSGPIVVRPDRTIDLTEGPHRKPILRVRFDRAAEGRALDSPCTHHAS